MAKIANRNTGDLVAKKEEFKANNIFAQQLSEKVYVCYSYGHHFPMYAHINGVWYGNKDRYFVTTSKHQGQANPHVENMVMLSTEELKAKIGEAY